MQKSTSHQVHYTSDTMVVKAVDRRGPAWGSLSHHQHAFGAGFLDTEQFWTKKQSHVSSNFDWAAFRSSSLGSLWFTKSWENASWKSSKTCGFNALEEKGKHFDQRRKKCARHFHQSFEHLFCLVFWRWFKCWVMNNFDRAYRFPYFPWSGGWCS